MCAQEGTSLQRGENFRLKGKNSVDLVSVGLGAPYADRVEDNGRTIIYEDPDAVDNGFTVESTLHKMFDAGAWTLTDDRKMLVFADFTGTNSTVIKQLS